MPLYSPWTIVRFIAVRTQSYAATAEYAQYAQNFYEEGMAQADPAARTGHLTMSLCIDPNHQGAAAALSG